MSKQSSNNLLRIIIQYDPVLCRYAQLLLKPNKTRVVDIVKWVFEEIYDEGMLYPGPHLRPLLIEKTKSKCMAFNRAVNIDMAYQEYIAGKRNHYN